jgi:predicted metal-dependent TIM-barrel fold hydrolase
LSDFNPQVIDSHVHLDHIQTAHPERIQWMRIRSIMPISWAFALAVESREQLEAYLQNQAEMIRRFNAEGLKCFFLSGIHPRNIPPDLRGEDVSEMLSPFLDDPLCLGIGEIGLETGSQREKEILSAQLDLRGTVRKKGKKIGIHTPRTNKPKIAGEILSLLENFSGIEDITVIDHCTPEIIGPVLEKGYWAGVTLSPVKASAADVSEIVNCHPQDINRIMCNTDSGMIFYEDLWQLHTSQAFLPDIRNRLTFGSAFEFFMS